MKTFILQIISCIKHRNFDIFLKENVEVELNSAALQSVFYDKNSAELLVNFNHGGVYKYSSVQPITFYELLANKSSGKFFVDKIRNSYQFAKIA